MTDTHDVKGACLCGAVKVQVNGIHAEVGACHCALCRRWGGGPFLTVDCGTGVSFDGRENISAYSSSDRGERAFCKKCGTHLYYRLKESNQHIMPVGLFDTDIPFVFDHQIFIDSKPSYYHFGNKTTDMTGEEVLAQFAQPGG